MKMNAEQAFNAVSLEERVDLLAKAQASGIGAMVLAFAITVPVAYGFDNIYLLACGAAFCTLLYHAFSSRAWRQEKPKLVLEYLAARTVGRRFGFLYKVKNLDVVFVLRGKAKIRAEDIEKTVITLPGVQNLIQDKPIDVWVCLLGSGLTVFSEREGGANLEFVTNIGRETAITKRDDERLGKVIEIKGIGFAKPYIIELSSKYPASLYMFEKKLDHQVFKAKDFYEKAIGMSEGDGVD